MCSGFAMPSHGDPKVKAPPVDGKANPAVIGLVTERFGVNA